MMTIAANIVFQYPDKTFSSRFVLSNGSVDELGDFLVNQFYDPEKVSWLFDKNVSFRSLVGKSNSVSSVIGYQKMKKRDYLESDGFQTEGDKVFLLSPSKWIQSGFNRKFEVFSPSNLDVFGPPAGHQNKVLPEEWVRIKRDHQHYTYVFVENEWNMVLKHTDDFKDVLRLPVPFYKFCEQLFCYETKGPNSFPQHIALFNIEKNDFINLSQQLLNHPKKDEIVSRLIKTIECENVLPWIESEYLQLMLNNTLQDLPNRRTKKSKL